MLLHRDQLQFSSWQSSSYFLAGPLTSLQHSFNSDYPELTWMEMVKKISKCICTNPQDPQGLSNCSDWGWKWTLPICLWDSQASNSLYSGFHVKPQKQISWRLGSCSVRDNRGKAGKHRSRDGREWVFLRFEATSVEVYQEAPLIVRSSALETDKHKRHLRNDIKTLFEYILRIFELG